MSSRPFLARYGGQCVDCEERWKEGDSVKYNDNDEIVHEDCEEAAPPAEKPAEVCTKCWVTKPCFCDT